MTGRYSNKLIYRNLTIIKIFSSISLGVAIICGILNCFNVFPLFKVLLARSSILEMVSYCIYFYFFLLFIPAIHLKESFISTERRVQTVNDIKRSLLTVSLTIMPFFYFLGTYFFGLPWAYFGNLYPFYDFLILEAYVLGVLLIPYAFLLVADGFILYNVVLIKREWCKYPSAFVLERIRKLNDEIKAENQRITGVQQSRFSEKARVIYEQYIQVSGIKFFIRYYRQVLLIPLTDIEVKEDYPYGEKLERLHAVKRIIDEGAAEYAFKKILETYGDILLDESDIEYVKSVLKEFEDSRPAPPLPPKPEDSYVASRVFGIDTCAGIIFLLLCIVKALALFTLIAIIPLATYYLICYKKRRRLHLAFIILTMIFVSVFAGALFLCDQAKVPAFDFDTANPPPPPGDFITEKVKADGE